MRETERLIWKMNVMGQAMSRLCLTIENIDSYLTATHPQSPVPKFSPPKLLSYLPACLMGDDDDWWAGFSGLYCHTSVHDNSIPKWPKITGAGQ